MIEGDFMSSIAGSGCDILVPFNDMLPLKDIERSIVTKYRKKIWNKFIKAIQEFNLVNNGDKIAVAVSGGKDSLLMAKLFQELQKYSPTKFELEFIVADPGYHPQIKELMLKNCQYLNIPIKVFDSGIFEIVDRIAKDYPCFMCAKMRRGALYNKAQELGCNKLALGHHYNDVIETIMLNILYAGTFKTMLPKLKSSHFDNLELIRPLYYIEEASIQSFTQSSGIWPLNCACTVAAKRTGNTRYQIKDLIAELKKTNKEVDKSIFNAAKNVNMDCIVGWEKNGEKHSYLDFYDD